MFLRRKSDFIPQKSNIFIGRKQELKKKKNYVKNTFL